MLGYFWALRICKFLKKQDNQQQEGKGPPLTEPGEASGPSRVTLPSPLSLTDASPAPTSWTPHPGFLFHRAANLRWDCPVSLENVWPQMSNFYLLGLDLSSGSLRSTSCLLSNCDCYSHTCSSQGSPCPITLQILTLSLIWNDSSLYHHPGVFLLEPFWFVSIIRKAQCPKQTTALKVCQLQRGQHFCEHHSCWIDLLKNHFTPTWTEFKVNWNLGSFHFRNCFQPQSLVSEIDFPCHFSQWQMDFLNRFLPQDLTGCCTEQTNIFICPHFLSTHLWTLF